MKLVELMTPISGYCVTEQLYISSRTIIYRAIREDDQQPVVIKLLKQEYPTFNNLVQFRNQYTIAKSLNLPGVIRPYSLENFRNGYLLVMEDFGGISLRDYIQTQPLDVPSFLEIAIQLATTLEGLYRHRVIHKDIKPANILIHPTTKQVKLIDFSIASLLPKETQSLMNPNVLEGTLAYLSPEQTGRMNRGIDYRTDFYSLGVTFFELLTQQLPFESDDPMELVYYHIAKQPPSVHHLNPAIPSALSEIVHKLMAKNAEDRYQSALGLKHDLEICRQQWNETETIVPFTLGKHDICDRFAIPEKLYGRKEEVAALLAAFERVAGRGEGEGEMGRGETPNPTPHSKSELLLVTGFSGIGKTAVVNEIHKPIALRRGYFIRGKFDQLQRNIPFSAFVQAFRDLMRQLLTESDADIERWKFKILRALGENGQVIVEVIPELESIIGPQPVAPALLGAAAQNRFHFLFQKFIKVFATLAHPLVIFLDDLQWADSASLKLMHLLISDTESQHLLLIGAYRDNEVSPAHPLMLTVEEIRQAGTLISEIALDPLQLLDLNHLIADTFHSSLEQTLPLSQLIYQKTKGNPFFINQFLKSLYEEHLITFDAANGCWQYNLSQIKALSFTDDVVEFVGGQLQKLSLTTQAVLKLAACIGNQFDLATLAIICHQSEAKTFADLWEALEEGLILPIGEGYKRFQAEQSAGNLDSDFEPSPMTLAVDVEASPAESCSYKFLHDRVQQAAYTLIPEEQKRATHLKIGQQLLANTPEAEREEKIFEIVNQLNYGMGFGSQSLLSLLFSGQNSVDAISQIHELEPTKKEELAQLNLCAGQKAKAATAYVTAMNYLAVGISLLQTDCWQSQYDLALALYESAAEAAYLCGEFEQMEFLAETLLTQAHTLLDKVKVYEIKIQAYTSQNRLLEAIAIARQALDQFGIHFPEEPTPAHIQQALQETAALVAEAPPEELSHLPAMADLDKLAVMRLVSSAIPSIYLAAPMLFPLVILAQVKASLQHGNAPESAFFYASYGILLANILQDISTSDQFGQLGLNLVSKSNSKEIKTRTYFVLGAFIVHGKSHIKETLPFLLEGYQAGLEAGNLEFVGYCIKDICQYSYLIGRELSHLEKEISAYSHILSSFKQTTTLNYCQIYWQAVLNLLGRVKNPCILSGEVYDEAQALPLLLAANDITGLHYFYLHRLILCYIFRDIDQALENAAKSREFLTGGTGFATVPIFYFYDSLTALAASSKTQSMDKLLACVEENQSRLKHWAHHAPMNYLHKFFLVEAERYRVLGQTTEAIEYYDRAIAEADKNGYLNDRALAYELAAKFYLAWGKEKIAQVYLADAYYSYARWGAVAKINDLENQYPQLLNSILSQEKFAYQTERFSTTYTSLASSSASLSYALDLATILKASQALSSEIQWEHLLSTLIQVLIENAGAEKCVLVIAENKEWVVVTQSVDKNVLQTPFENAGKIVPKSIINYVSRTSETVVLDDARTETAFITDSYILSQQPKSTLCTPIHNQGKLIGVLYLENNLTTGAFTHDRLEVLKILTSQAAISLQNAILYNTLEQKVEQRTHELNEKNQNLSKTLAKLKQTQTQLIQTEKMSSLGQMIAGVAHEINNPINFIYGNLDHAEEYCRNLIHLIHQFQYYYPQPLPEIQRAMEEMDYEFLQEDLKKLFQSMRVGADRIRQLVLSLRNFSRLDEAEMKPVDIHEGIDSTLLILQHRLKAKNDYPAIEVIKEYSQLPKVTCFASQLNQVFMNILSNAIDALEQSFAGGSSSLAAGGTREANGQEPMVTPTIRIRTELADSRVIIRIADNGSGMTDETKQRLFDPFFTTKPVGKGTGLGLSISYSIVEKHGGQLYVESQLGKGTEFAIAIPLIRSEFEIKTLTHSR
ncbi:trifunctional serine/threonine-protein kinase/ATP-binding protein/sensor histidine kinase [Leptothermofonsia sp. ETS-13]|uniref:trifunctional serine/threonine-protein kinase/ATP-binding protein/sensor histidine kinase n=1 Tax=Leptothermofonsia sp. ETS-13 TaxID=3035696 RepID=UPI003BA38E24